MRRGGLDVACERRRVARDVDDAAWRHPGEQAHDVLAGPRARRVEHREVGGDALPDERPQLAVDPVGAPLDVVEVLGVDDAVLDGRRGLPRRRGRSRPGATSSPRRIVNSPEPAYRSTTRSPGRGSEQRDDPGQEGATPLRGGPARSRGPRRRTRPPSRRARCGLPWGSLWWGLGASGGRGRASSPTRPPPASRRRHGTGTSTGSSGCTASMTSTDSKSGHSVSSTPESMTARVAMRQSSTGTTSRDRWRRRPARPDPSTANSTRVRQRRPSSSPGTGRTSTSTSRPATRANCSRTTAALSSRCVVRDACWKSHPPQRPGAAYGHGAGTRPGARLEHLDGVGAHEAVTDASLGHPRDDALAGQRVAHEDRPGPRGAPRSDRRARPARPRRSTPGRRATRHRPRARGSGGPLTGLLRGRTR